MSKPRELILTIKEKESFRNIHWEEDSLEGLTLSLRTGKITSIKLIEGAVLSIAFDSGTLLIDIHKNELNEIIYED